MSKYRSCNIRPAGLSDDDSYSDDDYSFPDDVVKPKKSFNYVSQTDERPNLEDFSLLDKKAEIETKETLHFNVMKACMTGNIQVISDFLAAGNDVNEFLYTRWTLLLYAASSIQTDTIVFLLDKGADPNKHEDGFTPLMALSNSNKENEKENDVECLELLLYANADPNATNKSRENALMLATKSRSPEFVKKLIDLTDNLNLTDAEGNTALHYAAFHNRVELVAMLLQSKVETEIKNRHGLTAYDTAVIKQYEEIAKLIKPDTEEEEMCKIMHVTKWQEMFPEITSVDNDSVLDDISTILIGMGLESYKPLFKGMSLKAFLNLTDEDLKTLGVELSIHRQRFLDDIGKLHSHDWNPKSLGFNKSKTAIRIFDGILVLGNIVKKFNLIGSSFNYIKRTLKENETKKLLSLDERKEYEQEIVKTEKSLTSLQQELQLFEKVAKKIEKMNRDSYPATYISKTKTRINWPIIIGVTAILSLIISKTSYVQRILQINQ